MIFLKRILLNELLKYEVILKEDQDIYSFGIECIFLKIVNYSTYILIAILMKMPLEILVIGIVFFHLRGSAGGYHAKTRIGCYIFSCGLVISVLLMCKFFDANYLWYSLWILSDIVIRLLAPLDNENKKFDVSERSYFKKKIVKNLVFVNIICIICVLLKFQVILNGVIGSMCMVSVLLLLEKQKRNCKTSKVKETSYEN